MIRYVSKYMTTDIDTMIDRARVLASSTRIDVWCSIGDAGMYPTDIASTLSLAPSTVTHHLHVLEDAGLVEFTRQGRNRLYRWTGMQFAIVTPDELAAASLP